MTRRKTATLVAWLTLATGAHADALLFGPANQSLSNVHDDFPTGSSHPLLMDSVADVDVSIGLHPQDWSDPGVSYAAALIADPLIAEHQGVFPLPAGHYLIDPTPEWFAANEQAIQAFEEWQYDPMPAGPAPDPADAPEPSGAALVLLGAAGLAFARRRGALRARR